VLGVAEHNQLDPHRLAVLARGATPAIALAPDHRILAPAPEENGAAGLFDAAERLLERLAGGTEQSTL